jgi:hypothetical protein
MKASNLFRLGMFWALTCISVYSQNTTPPASTFSSTAKGNIFTANEGALVLRLDNPDEVTGGKITLRDETGKASTLPVTGKTGEQTIPLPGKGYYAVEAEILRGSRKQQLTTSAAVVGPLLDDDVRMKSPLGLWTVQGDPDLVVAAGARWNRDMTTLKDCPQDYLTLSISSPIKPSPSQSRFTNVGVISFGLPLWMYDLPANYEKKGMANPFQKPRDWEQLRQLVKAYVVQHPKRAEFPPYFELYNEPEWAWKGSNEDLVKFEQVVADAVKEVRPDVQVLGPGFSTIRIKDPARLDMDTIQRLGLLNHLDGIVLHAYVDGSAPEGDFIHRVLDLQAWLAKVGKPDFPIHLTEFGWCTLPGTWQKPVDELTQARYAVRSLTLLAAAGVKNSTYFCLAFKSGPNAGERSFSIVHENSTPKPAFASYSNLARWLAGTESKGRWYTLSPTLNLVLFKKDGGYIAVLWDTQSDQRLNLPFATTAVVDMMGRPLPKTAQLPVSPSPLFLALSGDIPYDPLRLPEIRVMRGTTHSLPLDPKQQWIASSELQIASGKIETKSETPNGKYTLLAKTETGWNAQPVEVVPPLEVGNVTLQWPLGGDPELSVSAKSWAPQPLSARVTAKLEKSPDYFLPDTRIEPNQEATLQIPLTGTIEGRRYQGSLLVESRDGQHRDRVTTPLDFTLVSSRLMADSESTLDWSRTPAIDFTSWSPFGSATDPAHSSATFQSTYNRHGLHIRIQVHEDNHIQNSSPESLFSQDSIQLGFDPDIEKTWEANDLFGLKGHRVFEYGVAWNGKEAMNWRWISYLPELPVGCSEPRILTNASRKGNVTDYQIFFPWEVFGLKEMPKQGSAFGISIAVTDIDPSVPKVRKGMRLFDGIIDNKNPERFGRLWLR